MLFRNPAADGREVSRAAFRCLRFLNFLLLIRIPPHLSPDPTGPWQQSLPSRACSGFIHLFIKHLLSIFYKPGSTLGSRPAVDKTTFVFSQRAGESDIQKNTVKKRQGLFIRKQRGEGYRWCSSKDGRVNRKEALGWNILCDSSEKQDLPETSPLSQGESQENAPCVFSLLYSRPLSLPLLSYSHCHIFSILEQCLARADACHGLNCVFPCPIPKSHVEILYAVCSVAKSCLALWWPRECSPPGSSVHGVPQATIPERVAIPFSRISSWPRDRTQVYRIAGRFFTIWASRGAYRNTELTIWQFYDNFMTIPETS